MSRRLCSSCPSYIHCAAVYGDFSSGRLVVLLCSAGTGLVYSLHKICSCQTCYRARFPDIWFSFCLSALLLLSCSELLLQDKCVVPWPQKWSQNIFDFPLEALDLIYNRVLYVWSPHFKCEYLGWSCSFNCRQSKLWLQFVQPYGVVYWGDLMFITFRTIQNYEREYLSTVKSLNTQTHTRIHTRTHTHKSGTAGS